MKMHLRLKSKQNAHLRSGTICIDTDATSLCS